MKTWRLGLALLGSVLLATPAAAGNVGFETLLAPFGAYSRLTVGVWYPTAAPTRLDTYGIVTMDVAPGAPVRGAGYPLVVMSHGNGGSLYGHTDTAIALAKAGFVVAAVTHPGDNYRDHSQETQLQNRPTQVSAMIDAVLQRWSGHASIDAARIGMFGFSAGGFTTLIEIGGKPDFSRIPLYCNAKPVTFVCTLLRRDEGVPTTTPPVAWVADPRIKAAVIAAPGLGFTFSRAGLAGVKVPVQLWAAQDDEILSLADDDETVRDALPGPVDYHLVPGAHHFDFLTPCTPAFVQRLAVICADPTGFDRAAFHARFNAAVVEFFGGVLR